MFIGSFLLIIVMYLTFIFDDVSANEKEHLELLVVPIQSLSTSNHQIECQDKCSIDYCLKYAPMNKNCTKLIRDQCDCCTVCLRNENDICGGKFHVYGICQQNLICYKKNQTDEKGICLKACMKYQCLLVTKNNKTICECANRRVTCDKTLSIDNCQNESRNSLASLKTSDIHDFIDCSNVICKTPQNNSTNCPSDSQFLEDPTPSFPSIKNLSSICCQTHGHCACSPCPKTICEENSILQISRTGNPQIPGQCCDQYTCIKNSKQCHHDKKIYNENETWTIDHCTTCTCRSGLVDCAMVQCPIYTHCGYMYTPENECCPKCGGCLNDRLHVQHMNSTWIESNGCMRCWCENGRSRCIAEGCIAPPCENPRQIANVCCPVCDDGGEDVQAVTPIISPKCPPLDNCYLACEHGLTKDEYGCSQCACSTMSCPSPLCTLKFDKSSKQYCLCSSPLDKNCGELHCDKHCPYNYSIDKITGCPLCQCNPCPQVICAKNCTYGLKKNEVGCPICVCEGNITINTNLILHIRNRQCHTETFSYSNGEIWFDGCRQCLCREGEQLCALISCPVPRCSQPILLPNRCCPSCPDIPMLPEPIPSSQVCYASQYVTGEELEFDKCTKCICLHNIAFCSIALCPPLSCSIPIYDSSLCCPICPPETDPLAIIDQTNSNDEDVCILDNGLIKHAGELWKNNDCQSCLCPRGSNGQIECYSQICEQNLPCSNPVLKKGQCCPFCLPPTAAVAVCIFNYIQYRSGEHWNVSECHHCQCLHGTIVCHQHKCPLLTCIHTVTLAGHCCPICHDQLPFINNQDRHISSPRFGFSIILIFSILILILILVIFILLFFLLHGRYRSYSSTNRPDSNHSPILSTNPTMNNSKLSYRYNLMLKSNEIEDSTLNHHHHHHHHLPRTSTQSMLVTNSSNNELEHITYDEDDTLILHCSTTTSNDDDYQHDLNSTDNEESQHHQQQQQQQQQQTASHSQFQMMAPSSTFIYV